MDAQSLLCGLYPTRRSSAATRKKNTATKAHRKHLPQGTGEFTVGCMDIMTDYGKNGVFLRLYYPTNSSDVFVSSTLFSLYRSRKYIYVCD